MSLYPKNLVQLMDMFPDDSSCLDYLRSLRWPNGYQCTRCNSDAVWKLQNGLYRCPHCRYASSVIAGTLFQGTHKPLRLWFQVIWYVVNQKNGVSALGLQKAVGLGSYHTAWNWLHKLRRAMVRPNRDKLHGRVEVNETILGGAHAGKRGRGAEGKALVLIAVEEKGAAAGRIRLSMIPNASSEILIPAIKQMVDLGSTIMTDGWNGYSSLQVHGYTHVRNTNHNVKDIDSTPLAHLVASLLQRWLLGTHQGAVDHINLPYYLDEFTFRFNRRTSRSRGKLFYRLIQQSLEIEPVTEKMITTRYGG